MGFTPVMKRLRHQRLPAYFSSSSRGRICRQQAKIAELHTVFGEALCLQHAGIDLQKILHWSLLHADNLHTIFQVSVGTLKPMHFPIF